MQAIFDFLVDIGHLLSHLFGGVILLFDDIVYIIGLGGKFLAYVPSYFAFLPNEMLLVLGALFSLIVVYKVLGREG